jgi:hypothetical protein
MGDRSNIVIEEAGARVWLYGHWMGASSIGHAAHGLRSDRVHDAPYLARIIFSSMVRADIDSDINYGISTRMVDNQHPIIVLDVGRTTTSVRLEDSDGEQISRTFTPEEFLDLAASSSWSACDPFDPTCDHDLHDWPFQPFVSSASDAEGDDATEERG